MNSKNSKTSDLHRLLLNLRDKIDLRRKDKYIALLNLSICNSWKNIKKSYKTNEFKILGLTWNEEFELPGGSYSIPDIQDYLEYLLKKHGEKTVNLSIKIYTNKMENRITFKIKTGYYLEVLTPEKMELIGCTESEVTKNKNVLCLEITEVVLIHCNVVNNSCQENSRVLYALVPNTSFGQLLGISPENLIF